jgi:ABC-type lipoprotein export system ATPase subunit
VSDGRDARGGLLGRWRRPATTAAEPAAGATATVAAPVLSARGLTKTYGDGESLAVALAGVDVDLFPGELLAVIGPSGSGKSTLLHLLAGIDTPSAGTVEVEGEDLGAMSDAEAAHFRARRVGFVLQRDNLIPSLTVRENAAAPLMLAGVPRGEATERATELLERVGLGHRLDAYPSDVSGGEAQRAAVARACSGEPLLVFADEPTGALDQANGEGVVELLGELVAAVGAAGLIVTHDPGVAARAERTLSLLDGRPNGP